MKSSKRCNWPELAKYCGCCRISTGIYIRSVLFIIVSTSLLVWNVLILIKWMKQAKEIHEVGAENSDIFQDVDIANISGIMAWYHVLVIFYMSWCGLKFFEVIRNVWTIYAMYKESAWNLKILLYIGIPCWIFDIILSLIASIILPHLIRLLLLATFLSEGYNHLAIYSHLQQITGKSRLVSPDDLEQRVEPVLTNGIVNPPHRNIRYDRDGSTAHCSTCTCWSNQNSQVGPENTLEPENSHDAIEEIETLESNDENEPKTLNFKDQEIVYNIDYNIDNARYSLYDRQNVCPLYDHHYVSPPTVPAEIRPPPNYATTNGAAPSACFQVELNAGQKGPSYIGLNFQDTDSKIGLSQKEYPNAHHLGQTALTCESNSEQNYQAHALESNYSDTSIQNDYGESSDVLKINYTLDKRNNASDVKNVLIEPKNTIFSTVIYDQDQLHMGGSAVVVEQNNISHKRHDKKSSVLK